MNPRHNGIRTPRGMTAKAAIDLGGIEPPASRIGDCLCARYRVAGGPVQTLQRGVVAYPCLIPRTIVLVQKRLSGDAVTERPREIGGEGVLAIANGIRRSRT